MLKNPYMHSFTFSAQELHWVHIFQIKNPSTISMHDDGQCMKIVNFYSTPPHHQHPKHTNTDNPPHTHTQTVELIKAVNNYT